MLCCVQMSAQSLEAIVLIGAKSVGRISECCMHVGMQIQGAAICYTLPSTHRRFTPRLFCSLLCFDLLGAMITVATPFFAHNTTLDKFCVQVLYLFTGCFSSSFPLIDRRCPHFAATCGPAPKPNLSRVRSQNTPTSMLHL